MRALVLSAPVGESHAEMARSLAADLRSRGDSPEVTLVNDFAVLGTRLGGMLERGLRRHLGEARQSYDVAYWLFTRVPPAQRFGEAALYRFGGDALAATIARHDPDVVVSTYPILNPVLARLRRSGRLRIPVAAVVGPLGGLGFWIAPGVDLHMLNYAEAIAEVRRGAPDSEVVAVRPLVRDEFFAPTGEPRALSGLEIPPGRRLVVVSGGGWGAGDLAGAITACLAVSDAHVLAIAGRNQALRGTLTDRHRGDDRVTVLGFVDDMGALLRAADAMVTATAGLSIMESLLSGCPAICYGFAVGHVRDNTAALQQHGLARVAATAPELTDEVAAALAQGRRPPRELDERPTAGEVTAALAGRAPVHRAQGPVV